MPINYNYKVDSSSPTSPPSRQSISTQSLLATPHNLPLTSRSIRTGALSSLSNKITPSQSPSHTSRPISSSFSANQIIENNNDLSLVALPQSSSSSTSSLPSSSSSICSQPFHLTPFTTSNLISSVLTEINSSEWHCHCCTKLNPGNTEFCQTCGRHFTYTDSSYVLPFHSENHESFRSQQVLNSLPDLHECDEDGWSSLHAACFEGNEPVVAQLLAYKSLINKQTKKNSLTPLHLACYTGNFVIVKMLVENNCDINLKTKLEKNNCLHIACELGLEEIGIYLLNLNRNLLLEENYMKQLPIHLLCLNSKGDLNEKFLYTILLADLSCGLAEDIHGYKPADIVLMKNYSRLYDLINRLVLKDRKQSSLYHKKEREKEQAAISPLTFSSSKLLNNIPIEKEEQIYLNNRNLNSTNYFLHKINVLNYKKNQQNLNDNFIRNEEDNRLLKQILDGEEAKASIIRQEREKEINYYKNSYTKNFHASDIKEKNLLFSEYSRLPTVTYKALGYLNRNDQDTNISPLLLKNTSNKS